MADLSTPKRLTKAQWKCLQDIAVTETCGVRFWRSIDALIALGLVRRVPNDERNASGRAGKYQGPLAVTPAGRERLEQSTHRVTGGTNG